MKTKIVFSIAISIFVFFSIISCNNTESTETAETPVTSTENITNEGIQAFYFHSSNRCATCIAVEDETLNALNQLYPEEMKSKKITFQSINMDEAKGEELAEKMKIAGQTLIIINGEKRVDLTNDAFMYAKETPEKLKAKIQEAVDGMKL